MPTVQKEKTALDERREPMTEKPLSLKVIRKPPVEVLNTCQRPSNCH